MLLAQDHLNDVKSGRQLDALSCRYLSFLEYAFDDSAGRFRGAMSYDRHWRRHTASEDTHAIAIWALGEAVARCQVRGHMTLAANLFQRAAARVETFEHPHAWAYSLIGIHAYLRRFSGDSHARRVREDLAGKLIEQFKQHGSDDWPWLNDQIDYAAARLPHALLLSGRWMFNDEMIQLALRSLDWLHDVQTGPGGQFAPVGTDGWYPRDQAKTPLRSAAHGSVPPPSKPRSKRSASPMNKSGSNAPTALNWFLGDNDLHLPLYDHTTGGCHDALRPDGVDEDQSAEATLAWLLSLLNLYEQTFDIINIDAQGQRLPRPTKPALLGESKQPTSSEKTSPSHQPASAQQ